MFLLWLTVVSFCLVLTENRSLTDCDEVRRLSSPPKDCLDIDIKQGSELYKIYPTGSEGFNVYCEMDIENVNGGWTVFQKRLNGKEYFFRDWREYKVGFGNLHEEFWLGNDKIHMLTSQGDYELMIVMSDFSNETVYAKYTKFRIEHETENYRLSFSNYSGTAGNDKIHMLTSQGDYELMIVMSNFSNETVYAKYTKFRIEHETENYRLSFSNYSGTAGDSLTFHQGQEFSTKDRDNDESPNSCANAYKGGWWYAHCHRANLNGLYLKGHYSSDADGINWKRWTGHRYSLKTSIMMIRRA